MCAETLETTRIPLEGDWSMGGVAVQFPQVMQRVAELTSADARPMALTLDLSGIAALDASGCQLLALVARTLRGSGIAASCFGLTAPLADKVRILGFAAELGCAPKASGERS